MSVKPSSHVGRPRRLVNVQILCRSAFFVRCERSLTVQQHQQQQQLYPFIVASLRGPFQQVAAHKKTKNIQVNFQPFRDLKATRPPFSSFVPPFSPSKWSGGEEISEPFFVFLAVVTFEISHISGQQARGPRARRHAPTELCLVATLSVLMELNSVKPATFYILSYAVGRCCCRGGGQDSAAGFVPRMQEISPPPVPPAFSQ